MVQRFSTLIRIPLLTVRNTEIRMQRDADVFLKNYNRSDQKKCFPHCTETRITNNRIPLKSFLRSLQGI